MVELIAESPWGEGISLTPFTNVFLILSTASTYVIHTYKSKPIEFVNGQFNVKQESKLFSYIRKCSTILSLNERLKWHYLTTL